MGMKLYDENVLSLGKVAELAGKHKGKFMELLLENKIDVIRYTIEELDEEIKLLRNTP